MATIVTRSGKGSPLTHAEVDANFENLNSDKIESGNTVASLTITSADINGGTIDGTVIGGSTPAAISGTTGSFSGNLTVDTDTLFVDAANNRVGIGTSSPAAITHISENNTTAYNGAATDGQVSAGATLFVQQTGGSNNAISQIAFQPRSGFPYNRIVNSGGSAPFMTFVTNNAERVRITSSGNVGIGTSTPNAASIVDAQSTTKGVRFPNMTTTQKDAIANVAGNVVFDTTLGKLCVNSGSGWETITSI